VAVEFTIDVDAELGLVRAVAWGADESLEQTMEYSGAVIEAAVQATARKILCDERRLEYRLSTIDIYKLAEFISANAAEAAKVALVVQPGAAADRFFEDATVNRGMQLRLFTGMADARKWLGLPAE
jgi:hypothetical protein